MSETEKGFTATAKGVPASPTPTPQTASKRLLSIAEAASELGVSTWTLRDLIASKRIRSVQPPGLRRIYLDRRDIDKAIEAWKQ